MAKMQYQGTGRRKSSVARVRLIPGTGKITVNKKDLEEYFGMEIVKREVKRPFEIAGCEGKFDVIATVHGGGFSLFVKSEGFIQITDVEVVVGKSKGHHTVLLHHWGFPFSV